MALPPGCVWCSSHQSLFAPRQSFPRLPAPARNRPIAISHSAPATALRLPLKIGTSLSIVVSHPNAIHEAFTPGSVNRNTAPLGSFLSAHSRPPWPSMIDRQIDSPIPTPLDLVV